MSVATVGNLSRNREWSRTQSKSAWQAMYRHQMLVRSSLRILIWQNGHFVKAHRFLIRITRRICRKIIILK